MPAADWNPEQYERFKAERRQPFLDLLALVEPRRGMRVVDLGCGTGELTQLLHERLQARETLGIDSSAAMLQRSAPFVGDGLSFQRRDFADLPVGERYDLLFSNAALHWAPEHEQLFPRLAAAIAAGGQLAVQVPANYDHPSHTVAKTVASEPPFRDFVGPETHTGSVLVPEAYAVLLDRLGFRRQHVRLQVYAHHLPARDAVVEWVKGTLLVSYETRLPAALFAEFLERYRQRLLPQLADTRPYFYPFKRILLWGAR